MLCKWNLFQFITYRELTGAVFALIRQCVKKKTKKKKPVCKGYVYVQHTPENSMCSQLHKDILGSSLLSCVHSKGSAPGPLLGGNRGLTKVKSRTIGFHLPVRRTVVCGCHNDEATFRHRPVRRFYQCPLGWGRQGETPEGEGVCLNEHFSAAVFWILHANRPSWRHKSQALPCTASIMR